MNKQFSILNLIVIAVVLQLGVSCKNDLSTKDRVKQPNIVLLFVDDYGWSDVGYRNSEFNTPNINKLKSESLEFTRAYIPTPTCSPSRYSLVTGKEAVRIQMVRHIAGNPEKEKFSLWAKDPAQMPSINYMPLEEVTYAEKLKEFGYYNMLIGKWHLGHSGMYPTDQGFDDCYGTTNAGHPKNYYYPFFRTEDDPQVFLNNASEGDYLTDVLTDKAVSFIKEYDKEQPFMLSFWYYSVHGPSVGRKDVLKKYREKGIEDKYAHHLAMVEAMDESVGRVRLALADKGIDDNTVIIFLSDQGGAFSNAPLSGGKKGGNTLGEGGARVPFMMHYPNVTKPNSEVNTPVQSIDVFPTLMEIASRKAYTNKTIQGVSLLPILKGDTIAERNLYFFRSYEDQYSAVISGDWKLIKYHSGTYKLFNITQDISEQHDLINTGLKIEQELKQDLLQWEEDAVPDY